MIRQAETAEKWGERSRILPTRALTRLGLFICPVSSEGHFKAHEMGTSEGVRRVSASRVAGHLKRARETPEFALAGLVPKPEPLALALAAHRLFADQASMPVEHTVAASSAERSALVINRRRQLRAAMRVAAIVA
jgi:hypothetical protein